MTRFDPNLARSSKSDVCFEANQIRLEIDLRPEESLLPLRLCRVNRKGVALRRSLCPAQMNGLTGPEQRLNGDAIHPTAA